MRFTIPLSCALAMTLGCGAQPETETASVEATAATASAHGSEVGAPEVLVGTVVETMDAGGYTYFELDAGTSKVWAAANEFDLQVGETVTIPLEMPMQDFHSDTLDRTFPLIYFVSVVGREGDELSGDQSLGLPPGHPRLAALDFEEGALAADAVGAAEGATPIAEVWSRRGELAGSQVIVTGRVVKYNGGILGRNWLHVQDGSGALEDGTNDLTVTTETPCAVGDVVTATGTLAVDRDFGSGYTYTVILEDATITK